MTLFPIMSLAYSYEVRDKIHEMREAGVGAIIIGIPWDMIAPHEAQARSNHSQTLQRLAERGGLSEEEALWILRGQKWRATRLTKAEATRQLGALVAEWQQSVATARRLEDRS